MTKDADYWVDKVIASGEAKPHGKGATVPWVAVARAMSREIIRHDYKPTPSDVRLVCQALLETHQNIKDILEVVEKRA